jgi:hypothetical protein
MADTCIVYCKHGTSAAPLVLGVNDGTPTQVLQRVPDTSHGAQVWSIHPIPFSGCVFLRHEASGLFAKIVSQGAPVVLAPLDPQDSGFVLQLMCTRQGFVNVDNTDGLLLFTVQNGSTQDRATVIADLSSTADNSQEWLFAPTGI